LTGREIRQQFLKYFEEKDHTIVKSSSLVPRDDPSLMFTNAGMVQFKSVFLGEEKRPYIRATSSQKCLRVSGKHNDLENVGRTARHHTFFEMLGNFSFGDYFKEDAIRFGWDFLVERMGLPAERLWISIFREDNEAFDIWRQYVPAQRIVRMDEKDNFWAMGLTGPCGPCSEIILDQGFGVGCGREDCSVFCDCDRHLELWNLVFMQFNQFDDGRREPLPKPSIDTGMGLERLAAVMQGKQNNFHADLFEDLFEQIQSLSGKMYGKREDVDVSIRVIADHSRATAFLISDGVIPSNEGRGYELRRIMRRALRHGKMLGFTKPFLHQTVQTVASVMQDAYPELSENLEYISRVTHSEEERFLRTLDRGMALLEEETRRLKKEHDTRIPGPVIFRLYDTFGFPVDLTSELAEAEGLSLDMDGFQQAMEEQRQRSREHWTGSGSEGVEEVHRAIAAQGIRSTFTGYERLEDRGRILRIAVYESPVVDVGEGKHMDALVLQQGIIQIVGEAHEGDRVDIVTDITPFYGQAGGQVGDVGAIEGPDFIMEVENTAKPMDDLIVHQGTIKIGIAKQGDPVTLRVDAASRSSTMRSHSATHLLQWALRTVLGNHVKQSGSEVSPHGLRFDFTHMTTMSQEELDRVEDLVNRRIIENHPVRTTDMPFDEAMKTGATAIFEEKYGDRVRLVDMGGFSRELCGGTHVRSTGDIGVFKIIHEGSIGASLRRIEALTGTGALARFREDEKLLQKAATILRAQPAELVARIQRILDRQKELERELETLKSRLASQHTGDLMDKVRELDGVRVLSARVEARSPRELRDISDKVRDRLRSGVIVLGAVEGEKAFLVAMVTKELTDRLSAVDIIRQAATKVGGSGGGRADMAQAGGHRPEGLSEALEEVYPSVESILRS